MSRLEVVLASALVLASATATAREPVLNEFDAQYAVSWGGMGLGQAQFRLRRLEGDCYQYDSKTKPSGLVRMFYGEPFETAEFCIVDGAVKARSMAFSNPKRSKDNFTLDFDWGKGVVRGPDKAVRELSAGAVDRLSMQQSVRLWLMSDAGSVDGASLTVTLVDDDRIRDYELLRVGIERVETPSGNFDALRVDRVDDPNKTVKFWLAPDRDYRMVKFEQQKGDKPTVSMVLVPPGR